MSESIEVERGNLLLSPPSIWDQTVTNEPKIKNKNLVKFLNYDGQGGTGNVNHYTQILNGTSLEYLVTKNITA